MRYDHHIAHKVLAVVLLLSVQTFASGEISGIRYADGHAMLTIVTTAGERYLVQCSTDLTSGEWTTVREFIATADSTVQSIPSLAPSCYFRVVKQETGDIPLPSPTPPPPPPPPPPGG